MKTKRILYTAVSLFILFFMAIPLPTTAQDTGDAASPDLFTKEELAQMLAPIALYPDSLIAQILMASTYPLEVVEAERWLSRNKDLKGDALNDALLEKTWDPSIESLCHFPDVLLAMSEKLDQTRKLGDAFLGQEEEVMAVIQELRKKAEEQGNLKTTKEQQVIVEREIIRIEPADPEVVYVPVYDPFYVYGPWWYPAYPPYYWYYPPGFVTGGFIRFRPRIFIGFGLFSWVWFDWPTRHIHIDIHKTKRFHRYDHRRDYDRPEWRHNPSHRKGVAYRDRRTSQHFGTRPSRVSPSSPERRGYPGRIIEKPDRKPSQGPDERREKIVVPQERKEPKELRGPDERREKIVVPQERKGPEELRGPVERKEGTVTPKMKPERERIQPVPRDTPFRGIDEGSFERKASERGVKSRQRVEIKQQGRDSGRQGRESRQGKGSRR
jgi:hypothetical protein